MGVLGIAAFPGLLVLFAAGIIEKLCLGGRNSQELWKWDKPGTEIPSECLMHGEKKDLGSQGLQQLLRYKLCVIGT